MYTAVINYRPFFFFYSFSYIKTFCTDRGNIFVLVLNQHHIIRVFLDSVGMVLMVFILQMPTGQTTMHSLVRTRPEALCVNGVLFLRIDVSKNISQIKPRR